jgi:hypothetical protein
MYDYLIIGLLLILSAGVPLIAVYLASLTAGVGAALVLLTGWLGGVATQYALA